MVKIKKRTKVPLYWLTVLWVEVNQELSIFRNKTSKQKERLEEMESQLEVATKKNRDMEEEHQRLVSQQPTNGDSRPSTPDKLAPYYYEAYNLRRSRPPRHGTPTTFSSPNTNPVKMVQEMVGRVRVSA